MTQQKTDKMPITISEFNGKPAIVAFKNSVESGTNTVSTVKIETKDKTGVIASWGRSNNYPQLILKSARKNSSATRGISFSRKAHYGSGFQLVKNESNEAGKKTPIVVPINTIPEIYAFFRESKMNHFFLEIIADLEWFSIAFPEYIVNENYTKITRVKRQRAAWCRFEAQNIENGLIENVFISQKFGDGAVDLTSEFAETIPHVDPYWSVEEVREYCRKNNIQKFIRPSMQPLIDEPYYPISEWHSIYESGWLDVANSVPSLKKALFENQMSIKYLIEIDEQYFENIYSQEWKTMKVEERKNIRQTLVDSINSSLVGNEKAGKSIQSMMLKGADGKQYSAIKITPIDDKFKDGSYLPEAEAANSEILVAQGVDSSLIGGSGIPGGNGSGSGSDKREAFTIHQALKKTDREITLETFYFIRDFNKWDSTLDGIFENTILTTLDANPTGTKSATT